MNKSVSSDKPSLLRFIYIVSGISGLLLLFTIATALALSLKVVRSTNIFTEETLPQSIAIDNVILSTETATDIVKQLDTGSDVRVLLDSLATLDKVSKLLERGYRQQMTVVAQEEYISIQADYDSTKLMLSNMQELIENKIHLVRGKLGAKNRLEKHLSRCNIFLDALIVDVEYKLLKSQTSKTEKSKINEQLSILREIQNTVEKIQYQFANILILKNEKPIRIALQSIAHSLRESVESVSYLRSQMGKQDAFSLLADIYSESLSDEYYGRFRLLELNLNKKLAIEKSNLIGQLESIQIKLVELSSLVRADYAKSLKETKESGEIALFTFIVILIVSILIISFGYFYLIPRRIIEPLSDATSAIQFVGSGRVSFKTFNTDTQELDNIKKALDSFVENVRTLKNHEVELSVQKAQLEKFDQELKTFTRVSSHDLKSPLRGIRILCQLILDNVEENDYSQVGEHVQKIDTRISRLYSLLDSLLAFIHAGEDFSIQSKQSIGKIIEDQLDLLDKPSGIILHTKIDASSVSVIEAAFSIVIRNLVDNAIKHHDQSEGNIWVHIAPGISGNVYISIKDDGPGVPIHYQKRIFEPFETLKPKDVVEGSGMGLAILKKIINQMGGTITLKSPISGDRGSEFLVSWPI